MTRTPDELKCKAIDDLHSEIVWGIGSGEACHNKAWESADRLALIADELLAVLGSFGVLSCTPEWNERRNAVVAAAKGGAA